MGPKHWKTLFSVFNAFGIDISSMKTSWLAILRKKEKHHGRKFAVQYMKQLCTLSERYALYQPIERVPFCKSNKENLPKILKVFIPYLRGTTLQRIAALSVLRTVEDLRLPISKDISTVTDPCLSDKDLMDSLINFIPEWVKRIKPLDLPKMKYHYTAKRGPNGPALECSDLDVGALLLNDELYKAICTIQNRLNDKYPLNTTFSQREGGICSRLTQFPEKSGKTRTIAVVDYYSQRALKPLHKGLMSILRSMVSDGTYSHRNVGEYAKQMTKEKSFIACYDLSSFTDRFPAEVQLRLLEALLPNDPDLSAAFWKLLAERQFTVAWSGEIVTYNCGQPMGAYGSWPLCSLAHHLLVEYGGYGITSDIKTKYRLIGDDLIITDERLAQNYEKNISLLGVEINYSKTVKVEAHSRFSAAEIAKQLFLNGEALTPVTPGLIRNIRNPMLVNQAFEELSFRINIETSAFPPVLVKWLFPKESIMERALVLLTNPLNGALRLNKVNNDFLLWDGIESDELYENIWKIRLENLASIAESVSAGVIAIRRPDGSYEFGADWKLGTKTLEAQAFASIQIMEDIQNAQDTLMELLFDSEAFDEDYIEDTITALEEVEFLDDPKKPFMARKENRQIQQSSVILDAHAQLT